MIVHLCMRVSGPEASSRLVGPGPVAAETIIQGRKTLLSYNRPLASWANLNWSLVSTGV